MDKNFVLDNNGRYKFWIEDGVLKKTYDTISVRKYSPTALFAETCRAIVPAEVTTLSCTAFSPVSYFLNEIVLPPTIKTIEPGAFGGFDGKFVLMDGFTAAFLQDGVLYSGDGKVLLKATKEANGKKITIPEGVQEISPHAFEWIKIRSISLPGSLEKIGAYAFGVVDQGCLCPDHRVPEFPLHLSAKVKSIGTGAFQSSRISQITVDSKNKQFKTVDGVLFTKNGKKLIHCPTGKAGSFRIPEETEQICKNAFSGSTLSEVIIPGTFTNKLKPDCFTGSWIKKAVFEPGVTTLPESCLATCTEMQQIVIPESVTNIDKDAFRWTAVNLNYPVGSFGNGQATIVAPAGSYAINYAKRNGLKHEEI